MIRQEAERKLNEIFGFNGFYDNQWAVIETLFQGKRVLFIEKTGFGKSLCYQFPATQFNGTNEPNANRLLVQKGAVPVNFDGDPISAEIKINEPVKDEHKMGNLF